MNELASTNSVKLNWASVVKPIYSGSKNKLIEHFEHFKDNLVLQSNKKQVKHLEPF